ncbi:MAG: TSUP family transporter, partial [Anaerolineaceae bacterium]|nr:TSUP family transporter [Anaerolineaceae bacterium]
MKPFSPPRASWRFVVLAVVLVSLFVLPLYSQETLKPFSPPRSGQAAATGPADGQSALPWWGWSLILFVFCFVLGIVAVMAGIGGGVLYVPLVAGFFPFNLDFVRATGLLMALSGALAAGPGLFKRGLTNLRLVLPCAVFASMGGLVGAVVGLRMDPR